MFHEFYITLCIINLWTMPSHVYRVNKGGKVLTYPLVQLQVKTWTERQWSGVDSH